MVLTSTNALFYLRDVLSSQLAMKVGLVIVFQAAHFLIAMGYGGQHVFQRGTADCSSYNGLGCFFWFPFFFPQVSGN